MSKLINFLRYLAAILLCLVYIGVTVLIDIIIWKIAERGYYINPLKTSLGFTALMCGLFMLYLVFVICPVLPNRANKNKRKDDRE